MRCSTKGSDKISFIPALPSFIPYKAYFPYQYNTGVFASNGLGYPFGYPQTVKKGQQKLAFFDTIKTEVKIC